MRDNVKNASCRAIALLNIAIISTTHFIPIGAHPRHKAVYVYFKRKQDLNRQEQLAGESDDSEILKISID